MELNAGVNFEPMLRRILEARLPGRSIGAIRHIGGGAVNLAFKVRAGGEDLILRVADLRYRAGEHAVESWCFQRASRLGIPGPRVLFIEETAGLSCMGESFLLGERGDSPSVDRIALWETLGRYARIIHSEPGLDFCRPDGPEPDWPRCKWNRYTTYGIASLTAGDPLIGLGVYPVDQQPQIRAIFERLRHVDFRFGLYHNDFSELNVIIEAEGCVNIFDWGCAGVGVVPHQEIASILRWFGPEDPRMAAFLRGYGISPVAWKQLLTEVEAFQLLQAFDLVRWSMDRRPEQLGEYVERARTAFAVV